MFIQEATQPIQTDRSNTVYKKLLVIQESYGLNRFAAKPRPSIGSWWDNYQNLLRTTHIGDPYEGKHTHIYGVWEWGVGLIEGRQA